MLTLWTDVFGLAWSQSNLHSTSAFEAMSVHLQATSTGLLPIDLAIAALCTLQLDLVFTLEPTQGVSHTPAKPLGELLAFSGVGGMSQPTWPLA
jgi:hypothetical protein